MDILTNVVNTMSVTSTLSRWSDGGAWRGRHSMDAQGSPAVSLNLVFLKLSLDTFETFCDLVEAF